MFSLQFPDFCQFCNRIFQSLSPKFIPGWKIPRNFIPIERIHRSSIPNPEKNQNGWSWTAIPLDLSAENNRIQNPYPENGWYFLSPLYLQSCIYKNVWDKHWKLLQKSRNGPLLPPVAIVSIYLRFWGRKTAETIWNSSQFWLATSRTVKALIYRRPQPIRI